jgi:hypothetical protein
LTWLSIDGGNEAKADHVCYVAEWEKETLLGVWSKDKAGARSVFPVECVAVERTQADGRLARGKTTPKTMVGLAWNTAAVAYALAKSAPVHEYTISAGGDAGATDWIGGINKAGLHSRAWQALRRPERDLVAAYGRAILGPRKRGLAGSATINDVGQALIANNVRQATGRDLLKHDWFNVLDAVGVGLFHLGRVGKGAAPLR